MQPVCLPEKYEILGELGSGGMGLVYHARDRVLDREVALKILTEQVAGKPEFVERFLSEARAAASLNHPNIVQIYEFGETGKGRFLAMELVRGPTLKHELKRVGRFSEARTLDLALKACRALAVAHAAGIVHRDVKPENMMFNDRGEFKLVDLGLAKNVHEDASHTMTGQSLGTPHFISPEQILGARVIDARADVYSLGATVYNFATGSVPFDGTSGAHIMSRHLNDPLPDPRGVAPELSDGFCSLLGRMMAKEPGDRHQSMDAVEQDLLALQHGGRPASETAVPTALQQTVFMSTPQPATAEWDEDALRRVTLRLAEAVGPLAEVLVRKARTKAADWEGLTRLLTGNVPAGAMRDEFEEACRKIGRGGGATEVGSRSATAFDMTQPVSPAAGVDLDEGCTERLTRMLAQRIGPVAGALIKREVRRSRDRADLLSRLAAGIPGDADRAGFLAEAGRLDQAGEA